MSGRAALAVHRERFEKGININAVQLSNGQEGGTGQKTQRSPYMIGITPVTLLRTKYNIYKLISYMLQDA